MTKKPTLLLIGASLIVLVLAFLLSRGGRGEVQEIFVTPKKGLFEVTVTTSGELRAKNDTKIRGPLNLRRMNISQVKIADLVAEGTVVKKGDWVAELDKSEVASKISEVGINLQNYASKVEQERLDSALNLSAAREEIVNHRYALEERKLEKEQSTYEAPAIQRQAEINYEKAERALSQGLINYKTKVKQALTKMRIAETDLFKEQHKQDELQELIGEFSIKAPENGMVIYSREWNGQKRVVGSMVSTWEMMVATLPDLSVMESKTYVNEIDYKKIKPGQKVSVSLDSDPGKVMKGEVSEVANIGEQRPNSDSKVFEVVVRVLDADSTIRPAMTTSNTIHISEVAEAIFIPLECVHAEDSLSFVYLKNGSSAQKQTVKLGLMNENEVIILSGLVGDEQIYLSMPEKVENLK